MPRLPNKPLIRVAWPTFGGISGVSDGSGVFLVGGAVDASLKCPPANYSRKHCAALDRSVDRADVVSAP